MTTRLTLKDVVRLSNSLQALDGHLKLVPGPGKERIAVKLPFTFGGDLRWLLADVATILEPLTRKHQQTRDGLIREMSGGRGTVDEDKDPELFAKIQAEIDKLDAREFELDLPKIERRMFNLDINPIAPAVLLGLRPILADR